MTNCPCSIPLKTSCSYLIQKEKAIELVGCSFGSLNTVAITEDQCIRNTGPCRYSVKKENSKLSELIGVTFTHALRTMTNSSFAIHAYNQINLMPDKEWNAVCNIVAERIINSRILKNII